MGRNVESSPRESELLNWKTILPWQRDNEFILTAYRRASFSYITSLRSILHVHNETANIWSHLLGALLFVYLFFRYLVPETSVRDVSFEDAVAVSVYFMAVVVCFILSTTFHTFSDHSPEMHKFGNELDHLGIVFVMWGTGVSGAHFAFYCHHLIRNFYFVLLTATAVACGAFTLRPKFRRPEYRTTRFLMYVFLGLSLFAPVVHGLRSSGWSRLERMMGLESFLGLAAVNFSGAAVYAARVPERWSPGRFDLLGQSHNWMHLLVVAGALVRLRGLLVAAEGWAGVVREGGLGVVCGRL